jgi:glutamyl-tRNA reductase
MHVGVVGINHKLADLRLRELLAAACEKRFGLGKWPQGEHAFVLLSTCNRTEVYFSSYDLPDTHSYFLNVLRQEVQEDFEQKLYSYFGSDCFLHLTRVTSGLDSALVGETEIQGQVKNAYENTKADVLLPTDIHFLFQKCLKISKEVRSTLPLSKGMPDVPHAIWKTGTDLYPNATKARVLFIGASEINRKICHFLRNRGVENIAVCNRSQPLAHSFASEYNLDVIEWNQLHCWPEYDWIILGTKCPYYLILEDDMPSNIIGSKLIIDLSVPRNVDPRVGRDERFTLLNIDQIHHSVNRHQRQLHDTLLLAEMMIASQIRTQMDIKARKESHRLKILAVGA